MGHGIGLHSDLAAVNVNIWLTEDEANLEANSGGLLVYHASPPSNIPFFFWSTQTEHANAEREKLLQADGYRNTTIPYRSNRVVMFQSDLLHKSQPFAFSPAYEQSRVNLAFLFGKRVL